MTDKTPGIKNDPRKSSPRKNNPGGLFFDFILRRRQTFYGW